MKKPQNAKAGKQAEKQKAPKKQAKATKADKAAVKVEKQKAAATAAVGGVGADPKLRALFLSYMGGDNGCPSIPKLKKSVADASNKYRRALKEAKKDGFEQFMFDTAQLVSTPEGEAEFKSKLGRQLQAAMFMGSTIGNQLDLFNAPDRTPAVDRARGEGEKASMENKPRKPPYDASVPQFAAWMEGYDSHQKTLQDKLGKGKPEKPAKGEKPAKDEPAADGDKVVPITRAQMLAAQQGAGEADDADVEDDESAEDEDDAGGFQKRA